MQRNSELTRQMLGCGWASVPPERMRPFVQVPTPLKFEPLKDAEGSRLAPVCPGYLVGLPAVQEVADAWFWKHDLRMWAEGQPTPELMRMVRVLDAAVNEVKVAAVTPADKGGLA